MHYRCLAIIPARGGSKRIPRKNVREFAGAPIIKYSIEAAKGAGIFDEVMVSTEDADIARVAKALGAVVPFFRSADRSNDFAGTAEVLEEVVESYQKMGKDFDFVCCIYPTAPFVTSERLKEGMKTLQESGANSLLTVTRFSFPIQRSLKIVNGRTQMNWPEHYATRSQDLEPTYHDAGQFYMIKTEALIQQKTLYTDFTVPLVLPETEVQDIDNEDDWKIAEIKFNMIRNPRSHG